MKVDWDSIIKIATDEKFYNREIHEARMEMYLAVKNIAIALVNLHNDVKE